MCDEKKDYRYRGILRRYRKFEEHMCNAGKDRDPDICRYDSSMTHHIPYMTHSGRHLETSGK